MQPASATVPSSLTVIVLDQDVPSHEVNISSSSDLSIQKGGSGNYSVSLTEKPNRIGDHPGLKRPERRQSISFLADVLR